jgi:hypothetical protein
VAEWAAASLIGGGAGHFFDGDWMAVNPANPQQLFVTYTDDDFSGAVCGTGVLGTSIELVSSNDGGLTWGSQERSKADCWRLCIRPPPEPDRKRPSAANRSLPRHPRRRYCVARIANNLTCSATCASHRKKALQRARRRLRSTDTFVAVRQPRGS